MGLSFLSSTDQPGAAIYLLDDGSEQDKQAMDLLRRDLASRTKKQILCLTAKEGDGQKIIQFYHLRGTHFVLLVRDSDELHHMWSDGERFDASQIAYLAEQAG